MRIAAILAELNGFLAPLEAGTEQERRAAYISSAGLLRELSGLNAVPLPVRELNLLAREAGWHLRSLAGLVQNSKDRTDAEHAAWARASFEEIARCAGLVAGAPDEGAP